MNDKGCVILEKSTLKRMLLGLILGAAAGMLLRPVADKAAAAVKNAAPAIKKDGEKLIGDVAKEAKKVGKEIEASVMPQSGKK